jgi:AcrR family transcriptional regulator
MPRPTSKAPLVARPSGKHSGESAQKTYRRGRPAAGRPTRERARLRHLELLDHALEQFLEKGYALATIEAIAAGVGMTKRTVYNLYDDKRALFEATVERAIERWIIPIEVLRAVDSPDLEATLTEVARIRMAKAISPAGVRLQRIIDTESYRFPHIFKLAYEQSMRPTVDFLAELFRRHTASGAIDIDQPEFAAASFLSMVIGAPSRGIIRGNAIDEEQLEERICYCVRLFMNGARAR